MCGRYTLAVPEATLVEVFGVPPLAFDYRPRWNVAPGQECPVVAQDRNGRRMGLLRWGLHAQAVPKARDGFVNARAETVDRKPAFRNAFLRRRCLVPADGFYEWLKTPKGSLPHWFRPRRGGVLSLAGLWEGRTFTILTVAANADVAPVHHRMPAIVPAEDRDAWLARETSPAQLAALLRPAPPGVLEVRAVSSRINRVGEDDAGLLDPVGA